MTPSKLARHLFATYERFRCDHLSPANCTHGAVIPEVLKLVAASNEIMSMETLDRSIEGRSINMVTIGKGRKGVLLWSQMHGDETTATLAMMDMFNYLIQKGFEEEWVAELLAEVTLYFIPLLNPDGAEKADRRTAAGIDMNRDALDLATPEARILRDAQHRLKPAFGFNLHDQELSSVGDSARVAAIALLAPAADHKKKTSPARLRAMRLAATLTRTLNQFAEGHLTKYDDTFEPRAFGDNMQRWGTSTVLIESGHWPNDPRKDFIRKLNYTCILSALSTIGNGSYQDVDLDYYAGLPPNTKRIYDVIVRDVKLRHSSGWTYPVDIGLTFDPLCNKNAGVPVATIKDIGDLSTHGALQSYDARARTIGAEMLPVNQSLPLKNILDMLQLPQG